MSNNHYDVILSWEAPEYKYYPKNLAWFITLFVVISFFILYLTVRGDYFGAVSVFFIAIIATAFALHEPKHITYTISDKGFHIGDNLIRYRAIKHFWVENEDNHKTLHIETVAYLNHLHEVELGDQDPQLIRAVLLELLPEHPEPIKTIPQRIAHKIKL